MTTPRHDLNLQLRDVSATIARTLEEIQCLTDPDYLYVYYGAHLDRERHGCLLRRRIDLLKVCFRILETATTNAEPEPEGSPSPSLSSGPLDPDA